MHSALTRRWYCQTGTILGKDDVPALESAAPSQVSNAILDGVIPMVQMHASACAVGVGLRTVGRSVDIAVRDYSWRGAGDVAVVEEDRMGGVAALGAVDYEMAAPTCTFPFTPCNNDMCIAGK